jgi:hypothetical protein
MYPITCSETGCFHEWQDLSLFNVPMFFSSPLLCWIFHLEGISFFFAYINCNGVIILPYVFVSASFFIVITYEFPVIHSELLPEWRKVMEQYHREAL